MERCFEFLDKYKAIVIGACFVLLACVALRCTFPKNTGETMKSSPANITLDANQNASNGILVEKEEVADPVFIATGYYDVTLKNGEVLNLCNDPGNNQDPLNNSKIVYLTYSIYENIDGENSLVMQTDLINPGNQVSWVVSDSLDKGEHKLQIVEQPYTCKNGEFVPEFSFAQNILVTVE